MFQTIKLIDYGSDPHLSYPCNYHYNHYVDI